MDNRHPAALAALSVCEMSWKRAKIISGEEFRVDLKPPRWAKWSTRDPAGGKRLIWPKNMHQQNWLIGFSLQLCRGALSRMLPDVLDRCVISGRTPMNIRMHLNRRPPLRPGQTIYSSPPRLSHRPSSPLQRHPVTCWIWFGSQLPVAERDQHQNVSTIGVCGSV